VINRANASASVAIASAIRSSSVDRSCWLRSNRRVADRVRIASTSARVIFGADPITSPVYG